MKTIITLDRANQPYGYPQLNASGNFDNIIVSGLTANTLSATTYLNLPVTTDTFVTGFTLSSNTITLRQNITGQYSAFTISLSAYTGSSSTSGAYLPLSGGTVTGNTIFQSGLTANTLNVTGNTLLSGLTANTISATTYLNLPTYISATTLSGNVLSVTSNSSAAVTYTISAVTGGSYLNGTLTLSGSGGVNGIQITGFSTNTATSFTGGTVSGATSFISGLTANTISATTYQNVNAVTGGTYSNGTITLSGTGNVNGNTITGFSTGSGGLTWQFATSPITASTNNGYITTGTTLINLPVSASLGSVIEVVSASDSLFTITQNVNQFIRFGIITTTQTSGTLVSQNNGDSIRLVCTSANTVFTVVSAVGTITLN